MNLRGHIQPVRAPPPSAASPPAPVSLGSSLTAPPGPVRRVRRGPLLTVPPPPSARVRLCRVGGVWLRGGKPSGGGSLFCAPLSVPRPLGPFSPRCPLCRSLLRAPGQPTWSPWTPWSECSASCGPARRHRHRFCTGPSGGMPSSVALLPLLASAPPLCPGPEAEEEPCFLPECDRESRGAHMCPPPCPSQAQPLATASSSVPQELAAGALGDRGPTVAGAVAGVSGAGPEPVTSPHPRAGGITARGLGPRGQPARLGSAQVSARDGGGGQGGEVGKLRGASGEASREVGEWGSDPHSCLPTRCPPPGSDQLHRHPRGGVQRLWPSLPSLLR